MLLAKDSKGRLCCAKCGKLLHKDEVVKDMFLPRGCRIDTYFNSIGVCDGCHKVRLHGSKILMPSYWKKLSKEQIDNLSRYMRGTRSEVLRFVDDDELASRIEKL